MPTNTATFLRKTTVATRYSVTKRSIERAAKTRRLPAPEYPLTDDLPLWQDRLLSIWESFDRDTRAKLTREALELGLSDHEFNARILAVSAGSAQSGVAGDLVAEQPTVAGA